MEIQEGAAAIAPVLEVTPELARKRRSQSRIIFDRFMRNRIAVAGAIILIIMTLAVIFAPVLTHNSPTAIDLAHTYAPPSLAHPFGTDDLGHDEFARALYGGRVSLAVGAASMLVALFIGVTLGALAGYYGGWVDNLLMRVTDVFLAVPLYLIVFVLSASFSDGSIKSVVLIIAAFSWMYAARIVRSEFLAIKEREFILAARTIGAKDLRLMFRHILPNAAGPIIVNATLLIGSNIILEAVLSFFGFGIQPPNASWGSMLNNAQDVMINDPLLVYVPGLLIFLTVLCFNLIGDGLRDALDPYMTER
jgi:peptide/nickel transport system permease protein